RKHFADTGARFPVFFDTAGLLNSVCAPKATAEAFVFAADGRPVYRGRIDDQFAAVDQKRAEVSDHSLRNALTALVNRSPVTPSETEAVGEPLRVSQEPITYERHIAPLLYARCVHCHRPGEVAPFSLLSFSDAAKRADFLAEVTHQRIMP